METEDSILKIIMWVIIGVISFPFFFIASTVHYQISMMVLYFKVKRKLKTKDYNVVYFGINIIELEANFGNRSKIVYIAERGTKEDEIYIRSYDLFDQVVQFPHSLILGFPFGTIFRKLIEMKLKPTFRQYRDLYFL